MERQRERQHRNRSGLQRSKLVCLLLAVCFLISSLSGCIAFRPLRLPQLKEFERQVHKKYPLSIVECRYSYGAWVEINVKRLNFDDECAYTILGELSDVVAGEEFIQEPYALYEQEWQNHPKWILEDPPQISLNFISFGQDRYRFHTYADKVDSEQAPNGFIWAGYTVWWSNDLQVPPEKIEAMRKKD